MDSMHFFCARDERFEIRFASLFQEGRALAFPCNALGGVDMDALSERGRSNYLFARAMVGREFAVPSVRSFQPDSVA
jgi:hypothetical protein